VGPMEIRRATEADLTVMRRLWNEFTAEATFTPYPGSAFEPSLVTKHIALVAEEGDSERALRLRVRPLHPAGRAPQRNCAGIDARNRRHPARGGPAVCRSERRHPE